MVDTAHQPSRRTVVKAGLWAAPAVAVVNLTAMSAAHASAPASHCTTTTYTSHAFVVYLINGVYYAFKFEGSGPAGTKLPVGGINPNFDGKWLATQSPYKGETVIGAPGVGTGTQQSVWNDLLGAIVAKTYSNASGDGVAFLGPVANLAGVFAKDGSYGGDKNTYPYQVQPVPADETGQFLISKCA